MAETHNHTPRDYYTPTGPSDNPDVSGYLSQDPNFSAEMIECGNCDETFTIDEGLDIGGIDYCEECYDTRSSKEAHSAETFSQGSINTFMSETFEADYETRDATFQCPKNNCGCRGCYGCMGEDESPSCACCGYVFEGGPTGMGEHTTYECSCGVRSCAGCIGEDDPTCPSCGIVFEHTTGPFGDDGNYIGNAETYHLSNTMDASQQEDTDELKARASSPIIADYIQSMAEWGFNNQDHTLLWDTMCMVIEADENGEFEEHIDMLEDNYESEEGNAPVQDPMEFGEMANWTPLDGSEGLKRKRAETGDILNKYLNDDSPDQFTQQEYDRLISMNGYGDDDFDMAQAVLEIAGDRNRMNAESFAAEYSGPSTLSSALSGARKTGRNGKHLTIVQRLVAKYGIDKGVKIYKHFGIKQKRASPKVRGKVRGTKSGPRRYSEGRVGGAGRSQVYQKGDRTGSWTPSGGHTTRFANSGKAWYQERGLGTPVAGPIPDTALAGKSMGEKVRGSFVNPHGIVGYPFVPAQQRERKSKK